MEPELNPLAIMSAVLLALFFLIMLAAALGQKISSFCDELKYLNSEIQRAEPDKREIWLRRRRRLWLSLLPFVKR